MSQLPRDDPRTAAGWPDLVEELDCWGEAGRVATLWWRDDDAVSPSARLNHLLAIAGPVPVALAVIPGLAEPALGVTCSRWAQSAGGPALTVLQHGWRHTDHSAGGKKSEFPRGRSCEDVTIDLAAGRARLAELFGACAVPILVPPWNRFDDSFLPLLVDCGLSGISRAKARCFARPLPSLFAVNIHIDLVAWTDGRAFLGASRALTQIVRHLRARRLGAVCADEPTGILTHHLVQDEPTDEFLRRLVAVTGGHAAARWLDATEAFAPTMLVPG
jgi:hypothetical protein